MQPSLFLATGALCAQTTTEKDSVKDKTNVLDEVQVSIKKKYIKVESDKTTVSIKDNAMLSTGNAYDAVKKTSWSNCLANRWIIT